MSLYGYGQLYGSGYRYPRRPRKAYIGKDQAEAWTKAAIFNTAISRSNPWVQFLKEKGVYEIKDVFQRARKAYYKDHPYTKVSDVQRKISLLEKQLDTLREEHDAIERNAPGLSDIYSSTKVSGTVPYGKAVKLTTDKLKSEIDRINSRIDELKAVKDQLMAAAKK
jgi:outer membrane murein-binding lipoprotein Lpp